MAKYSISYAAITRSAAIGGNMRSSVMGKSKVFLCVVLTTCLAFLPLSLNIENGIHIERNESKAVVPVAAGAMAFIDAVAAGCGITSAQLIGTTVGMIGVGTGCVIANDAGISLGNDASYMLGNLVDAADYPSWDTLSSEDQTAWGSQENYNAAKYNSLMDAFGLGDARDRFYHSSGSFDFDSNESERLEQIGDIATNWINNGSNAIDDIMAAFSSDSQTVINNYMGVEDYTVVSGSNYQNWPAYMPSTLHVTQSNDVFWGGRWFGNGNSKAWTRAVSNLGVYMIGYKGVRSDGATNTRLLMFSKSAFNYGQANGTGNDKPTVNSVSGNPASSTYNGETYYYRVLSSSYFFDGLESNIAFDTISWDDLTDSKASSVAGMILFGGDLDNIGQPVINIVGFPSDVQSIPPETPIYYPAEITPQMDWDEFLTAMEPVYDGLDGVIALLQHIDSDLHGLNIPGEPNLQPIINYLQHIDGDFHNFSFYNNGQLKVHDEGVFTELSDIYALLLEISGKMKNWGDITDAPDLIGDFDFDEFENKVPDLLETISDLAPFGSILLLSEMYSIMANYTQIESPQLIFPFDFGGFDDQNHELVIDLSWLDDIKPLVNFFCIAMLVIAIANATIRIVEIEAAS